MFHIYNTETDQYFYRGYPTKQFRYDKGYKTRVSAQQAINRLHKTAPEWQLTGLKIVEKNPKVSQKKATSVFPSNGTTIRLYATDIVKIRSDGDIELNSGGHKTATTKRRMNEVADEFELYFNVFAKGGQWFIKTTNRRAPDMEYDFFDGIIIPGPQHLKNPKRKKTMRKKKRSAKQLANDKRLGRMAKARAKKKRGGRRKKVVRKKNVHATRRRTIRTPGAKRRIKRPTLKKSHLWIAFVCWPKGKVDYAYITDTVKPRVGISSNKGQSVLFKTKTRAHNVAKLLAKTWPGAIAGVANADATATEIRAACKGKA